MTTAARAGPIRRLWGLALCAAVVLHAVAFAAVWSRSRPEEPEDQLGAPAIEIGLDLATPRKEETDLPPGPEADASAASVHALNQTAKVEETDLPKAQPTETDDPDRLVAPDATKAPTDHDPTLQNAKADPTADSVASEAAAPPVLDTAREAPRSSAPAFGSGESAQRIKGTWQKELAAHLNRFKRYPATATRHGMTVTVTFTLDRSGHVLSSSLQQGSGDPAFDQAALAMLGRADPVPPPPPRVADDGLTFTMPVIFRDRKR